ncbi:MAG: alpha-2-macroglobulin family protein, partial [Pseudomonadota bacterium]
MLRFSMPAAVVAAIVGAALAVSAPAAAERVLDRLSGVDLPGFDYNTLRNVPIAACERACLADRQCAAFTYNERANWCFLKSAVGERTPYSGATSGVVRTVETAPALPLPDVAYLLRAYEREADQLAAEVDAAARSGTGSSRIDAALAASLQAGQSSAWLNYARSVFNRNSQRYRDRQAAIRTASGAAWLALRDARSPQDQGAALALLSAILERQGLFRPAITASEASVALRLDSAEVARLERLRAQHGFRVLDYAVNSEVETPRLCVQFSERLAWDAASLQRFVTLDGAADPAITVDNRQLCVEGLTHGERYEVVVREGVPSAVGENLRTAADFRAFVRDRAPSARFETNDYVLPASAQGVPVTTINTDSIELSLVQVNDRNLADVVRRGEFKRQLYPYEAGEITRERGAEVWTGTMPVETVRNQEVRTLVPVSDMIGAQEPGVYILTAQPAELADRSGSIATQWFVVSDLGLSTYSNGGTVDVFTRSLRTAEPTAGVEVTLLAANDEVLASGTSDAEGYVRLTSRVPAEGSRAPAIVTAQAGADDYVFLSLQGGAFELTDRGVEGRTAPGPVDAFLATERGVYRGGETVNATVLVRDDRAMALDVPVTVRVTRPDGVLSRRITTRADEAGGLALEIDLTTNAATGTWQLSAHIDPKGPAVGTTSFLVEDFVPQRIEVALEADVETAEAGDTVPLTVEADFLYGAPAGDLMLEGAVVLSQTATLEAFEGYRFGLDGEAFQPQRTPLEGLPRTGPDGTATFDAPIGTADEATGPLSARISVSVREPGGRQVSDAIALPVISGKSLIGIRPVFENDAVAEGSVANFEVIALDAQRGRQALGAEWTLTRIDRDFQWYRRDGRWFYDSIERLEKVATGVVAIGTDAPSAISAQVGWGRYRLEVSTADGRVASSMSFRAGWVNTSANADTPDVLEVHLDRERYAAGETATLRIVPRGAGKALVTVLSQGVEYAQFVDVPAEGAEVAIPVDPDWAPGAYVAATLYRNAAAGGPPLPERSVGVAYLDVDTADRRLEVAIEAPDLTTPRQTLTVPVRVSGLDAGETAYLTLAAVDVGILNITGYEPPAVDEHYFGQRRLGVELRDIYGDLIDASGARRGRIRSGGDGVAAGSEALPPTEDSVSLFTGVIETDGNGVANAVFEIPAFNGSLRLMAIVWSADKVGDTARDMTVRDPVVVAGSLPRFLAPDDVTRMRFDLHNVSHVAGEYDLTVEAEGPLSVDRTFETVRLERDERDSIELPIAATGIGVANITARLDGPDGLSLTKDYRIAIRPAAPKASERRLFALLPGEFVDLPDPIALGYDDDAILSVSVGASSVDTAGLIQMLDRFPYGCAEQTVSRALPLLYLNDVAESVGLEGDAAVPARIEKAIRRVLSYQSGSGGFGLWSPGTDLWLTAYVMDFLSRAREAGYEVPDNAFESGLDRLQSVLSYIGNLEGERSTEIAYATYVLARNGRAAIGDLRYFAQEKLADFKAPLARAQLAASLSFTGDQALADRLFRTAVRDASFARRPDRTDYGTPLRDAAAIVTLAAESRVPAATVSDMTVTLSEISDRLNRGYSTQEAAWLLLSANATQDSDGVALIGGEEVSTPQVRTFDVDQMKPGVAVENFGDAPLSVATTITGTPIRPLPPVESGLKVSRSYHLLDGTEIELSQVPQNERIVGRLSPQKTVHDPMRIMLTDLLPAGFEVENPRLLGSGDAAGVKLVQTGQSPEYIEFRDDRFAA